jgi:hypothetical protein
MADAYRALHPRGTAVVTQFSARPQLLVRLEKNHRPTALTYAEAVFSPLIPRPTPESIRYIYMLNISTESDVFTRYLNEKFLTMLFCFILAI